MIKDFDSAYIAASLARDLPAIMQDEVQSAMPEQTMPGTQEGDVMLAAGPSNTMTDAGSSIGPTPRNPYMGGVADFVRGVRDLANQYEIKQFVPLLGGMGVGDLLMGKSPEELEEWAYGNSPITMPPSGTGGYVPIVKTGRKEQLADTLFLGMDATGLGKSAGVAGRVAVKKLGPKAAEMIIEGAERLGTPVRGLGIVEPGPKILEQTNDLSPGLNVTPGNKIGVEQDLRVKISAPDFEMPDKPLLVLSTDEKNVNRQIENLDLIFNKFPDPTLTQDSWTRMLGYAFKSDEVPIPPYAAIKALESPENLAAPLRKLTQGQIDDASAGFKNAGQFKELYTTGKADVVTTGKLFLWSFLSRGVSPYVQEGLFMDAISGIEPFLKKAASGKFDKTDLDEYLSWASTVAGKGSGQPGSGAMHNLNAFGKNFLTKLATKDADGITGLQKIHEMMANPNMSGPQIRREFAKIGTGVGIDNKVVSFTLLVSGRDDVLVIDRVQLRNLWDDGRFAGKNLWDGRSEKKMVKQKDGSEVNKSAQIAGTALSEITYGAKGLLVYEALERAMAQQLQEAYKLVGREGDASLGRYHWETWVAGSQQEASHGTIDAIMREAAGVDQPFKGVTAKQGEYGMYDYGAKYGVGDTGPYFIYDTSKGDQYRFTVPEYRDMLESIKDPKSGIVPKNFKVSTSGNAPWFERPEVNRSKLDELITSRGTPVGNTPTGKQPIPTDGKSSTAAVSRSRAARGKGSVLNGGLNASNKGAN
jgi:hypothetical protein